MGVQKMSAELKTWCAPSENHQLDHTSEAALIATVVRTARAALALSQDELAHETGLSRRTIINIEARQSIPSQETVTLLKSYLASRNCVVRYSSSGFIFELRNFCFSS